MYYSVGGSMGQVVLVCLVCLFPHFSHFLLIPGAMNYPSPQRLSIGASEFCTYLRLNQNLFSNAVFADLIAFSYFWGHNVFIKRLYISRSLFFTILRLVWLLNTNQKLVSALLKSTAWTFREANFLFQNIAPGALRCSAVLFWPSKGDLPTSYNNMARAGWDVLTCLYCASVQENLAPVNLNVSMRFLSYNNTAPFRLLQPFPTSLMVSRTSWAFSKEGPWWIHLHVRVRVGNPKEVGKQTLRVQDLCELSSMSPSEFSIQRARKLYVWACENSAFREQVHFM